MHLRVVCVEGKLVTQVTPYDYSNSSSSLVRLSTLNLSSRHWESSSCMTMRLAAGAGIREVDVLGGGRKRLLRPSAGRGDLTC